MRTRMPGGVRGRGLAAPFYSISGFPLPDNVIVETARTPEARLFGQEQLDQFQKQRGKAGRHQRSGGNAAEQHDAGDGTDDDADHELGIDFKQS